MQIFVKGHGHLNCEMENSVNDCFCAVGEKEDQMTLWFSTFNIIVHLHGFSVAVTKKDDAFYLDTWFY